MSSLLQAIEKDCPRSVDDRFSKMLEDWSRKVPSSEWVIKLASALESTIVGRADLAESIRKFQGGV